MYHVIAAVLLIIAAIVYFVSTEQIYDIFNINQTVTGDINFRRTEKLVAAVSLKMSYILINLQIKIVKFFYAYFVNS